MHIIELSAGSNFASPHIMLHSTSRIVCSDLVWFCKDEYIYHLKHVANKNLQPNPQIEDTTTFDYPLSFCNSGSEFVLEGQILKMKQTKIPLGMVSISFLISGCIHCKNFRKPVK